MQRFTLTLLLTPLPNDKPMMEIYMPSMIIVHGQFRNHSVILGYALSSISFIIDGHYEYSIIVVFICTIAREIDKVYGEKFTPEKAKLVF